MDEQRRILVVEDELMLLNLLAVHLENAGFTVWRAGNAETALKMAKENNPQLILLDLLLPDGDGETLLENLRKDEKTKHIPIVVMTNLASEEVKKRCEALGCVDFLVKADFRIDQLIDRIKKIDENICRAAK